MDRKTTGSWDRRIHILAIALMMLGVVVFGSNPAAGLAAGTLTGSPAAPPKYSPTVPANTATPDTVTTKIGTLHFKDGAPDSTTVHLAYDQLDFDRGINAYLTGMAATSVYALCRGFEAAGIKLNHGIGVSEDLLDARSLFLTANTTTF